MLKARLFGRTQWLVQLSFPEWPLHWEGEAEVECSRVIYKAWPQNSKETDILFIKLHSLN